MKREFNFRIERLVSMWEAEEVCVEAETFEEAKELLKEYDTFNDSDPELLYDTLETITPGSVFKNTTEVYIEDDITGCYNFLEGVESL